MEKERYRVVICPKLLSESQNQAPLQDSCCSRGTEIFASSLHVSAARREKLYVCVYVGRAGKGAVCQSLPHQWG